MILFLCQNFCLACPLMVAVDVGWCHMKVLAGSPGNPVECLLLMTVIHVDADGVNRY